MNRFMKMCLMIGVMIVKTKFVVIGGMLTKFC